jgi:hypothetical protein
MQLDYKAIGEVLGDMVADMLIPLTRRISALESRQLIVPERGEKGDPGEAGPRGERGETGPAGERGQSGDTGPRGEKGERGDRGEPGPPPTNEQIEQRVAEYIKANPPQKGDKGDRGDNGADGKDAEPIDITEVVQELLSTDELSTLVALHVADGVSKYFEANPVKHGVDGKDGRDGTDGKDGATGQKGEMGERGEKGDPGADGVGLAGAMIDRDGELIVTTSKGDAIRLGKVVGKDGNNMADPIPEYDPKTHEIALKFGEREIRYPAGGIHYKGYWREGCKAQAGDCYSLPTGLWIATKNTNKKPCIELRDEWSLAARSGRDGVDGKHGRDLGPPPTVKIGV